MGQHLEGAMAPPPQFLQGTAAAPTSSGVRDVPAHQRCRIGVDATGQEQRTVEELLDRAVKGDRSHRLSENILQSATILVDQRFDGSTVVWVTAWGAVEVNADLMPHGCKLANRRGLPHVVKKRMHHYEVAAPKPEPRFEVGQLQCFGQTAIHVMTQEQVLTRRIERGDFSEKPWRHPGRRLFDQAAVVAVAEVLAPGCHMAVLPGCSRSGERPSRRA